MSSYANLFGIAPESTSVNNCVSGNSFADATFPANIEGTWGCQHKTTPLPGGEFEAALYLLGRQEELAEEKATKTKAQLEPPEQPTMPEPCEGVPKNPLCPKGNVGGRRHSHRA
jgi:hypothetical protein